MGSPALSSRRRRVASSTTFQLAERVFVQRKWRMIFRIWVSTGNIRCAGSTLFQRPKSTPSAGLTIQRRYILRRLQALPAWGSERRYFMLRWRFWSAFRARGGSGPAESRRTKEDKRSFISTLLSPPARKKASRLPASSRACLIQWQRISKSSPVVKRWRNESNAPSKFPLTIVVRGLGPRRFIAWPTLLKIALTLP